MDILIDFCYQVLNKPSNNDLPPPFSYYLRFFIYLALSVRFVTMVSISKYLFDCYTRLLRIFLEVLCQNLVNQLLIEVY
jgi:hypothetical protein